MERRSHADGTQDSILLGVHRFVLGRSLVVEPGAMEDAVEAIQQQLAFDGVSQPRGGAGGFVHRDDDVDLDRVRRGGSFEGEDVRGSLATAELSVLAPHQRVVRQTHPHPPDWPADLRDRFDEPSLQPRQLEVGERGMVKPEMRGSPLFKELGVFSSQFVQEKRIQLIFGACEPHLLSLYVGQGMRTFSQQNINSVEAGWSLPRNFERTS